MAGARAAEPVAIDQVELKRCLVVTGRVTGRMPANNRPSAFSEMVIDVNPQFVITAPRHKSPTGLQGCVAETEWTIPRTNKGVTVGDRSASLGNQGFEVSPAMTIPPFVAKDPLKALVAIANVCLQSLVLAGELSTKT